ncbi:tol-pal system-associated acyl-CoA thioesterase [Maricaulis sp.]|uniref:tol-pal system-associated acyl-CoA thioesterase n=1 Tax=Maricaulis sp. TaxID=1486257 RepID=UPI003A8FFC2D
MSDLLTPAAGSIGPDHIHRLPVRVYYEDTDFSGVVYHARYLHFFERGRTESLRACGIHHSELAAMTPSLAFAVRRMSVEFVRAARVDDVLVVGTGFRPQVGARLMMEQTIHRADELVASATVEAVCIDSSGRAKRPPAWMRDRWRSYLLD